MLCFPGAVFWGIFGDWRRETHECQILDNGRLNFLLSCIQFCGEDNAGDYEGETITLIRSLLYVKGPEGAEVYHAG
jgi:hypothetical protein